MKYKQNKIKKNGRVVNLYCVRRNSTWKLRERDIGVVSL